MSEARRRVLILTSNGDDLEEDVKGCVRPVARTWVSMIEFPGKDEWYIVCPTCGTRWAGGSTVLNDHHKPGPRCVPLQRRGDPDRMRW